MCKERETDECGSIQHCIPVSKMESMLSGSRVDRYAFSMGKNSGKIPSYTLVCM